MLYSQSQIWIPFTNKIILIYSPTGLAFCPFNVNIAGINLSPLSFIFLDMMTWLSHQHISDKSRQEKMNSHVKQQE